MMYCDKDVQFLRLRKKRFKLFWKIDKIALHTSMPLHCINRKLTKNFHKVLNFMYSLVNITASICVVINGFGMGAVRVFDKPISIDLGV